MDEGVSMSDDSIRCFVIADDYKWHVLTDSLEEFYEYTKAYLELMNTSNKENHYYFKNIFMSQVEFNSIQKNLAYKSGRILEMKTPKKEVGHLRLVD